MSLTWSQRFQYITVKTGIREALFLINFPFHSVTSKIHHSSCSMLSWEKMVSDTVKWCDALGKSHYDVVVGVPRVGMFVATIISCRLNIPLATPDSMIAGSTYFPPHMKKPDIGKILVVDDAVKRGMALWRVKDGIQTTYPDALVTSGALYKVTDFAECDIYFSRTFGYTSQESDLQQPIETP